MRKLVPLLLALILGQLYTHWTLETPPPAPAPEAPVAAAPVEVPVMYYHSPLDAPAMTPTAYTSMGYFSTDSSSHFAPTRGAVTAVQIAPTAPFSDKNLNWGDESERAEIQRLQSVYKLPRTGVAATLAGRVPASAYASN